jgi:hypothetical protein
VGGKHGCAIIAAIANGSRAALFMLIDKCPDLTIRNERGQTAWEIASEYEPPVEEDASHIPYGRRTMSRKGTGLENYGAPRRVQAKSIR